MEETKTDPKSTDLAETIDVARVEEDPSDVPPEKPPRAAIAQAAAMAATVNDDTDTMDTTSPKATPVFGPRVSSRIRRSSSAFLNFSLERELRVSPVIATLRKEPDNFEALLGMLTAGKAVLFLPVTDSLIFKEGPVSAVFFEMHVFVPNPTNDTQLMSLGGIRAIMRGGRLIVVGQRLSEHELLATWDNNEPAGKRTLWDTIDTDNTTPDSHPSIPILSETPSTISITPSTTAKTYIISRAIMEEDLERTATSTRTRSASQSKPATVPPYSSGYLPSFSFPSQVMESLSNIPSALFSKIDVPTTLDEIPSLRDDTGFLTLKEVAKTSRGSWIAADINRFVIETTNMGKGSSKENLAQVLDNFLNAMSKRLINSGATGSDTGLVMDGIHAYILAKTSSVFFDAVHREELQHDLFMQRRICLLSIAGFGLEHLGLPKGSPEGLEDLVRLAGIELVRADYAEHPKEKLDAIVKCHQQVADRMSSCFPLDGETSSADVLLPLLIYLAVRINPPRLVSNIRFVQKFYPTHNMDGYAAYCLTNLSAVHSYLESVDASMMELPTDLTSRKLELHVPLPSPAIAEGNDRLLQAIVDIPLRVSSQISELWPFKFPPPAPPTAPLAVPSSESTVRSAEVTDGAVGGESARAVTPTPAEGTGDGTFKDKFRDSLRKKK
ncbi:hypothetical protein HK097_002348 [Rhizophlyctis rosea]|uniref:VPS9 domain-containing protein n=1 Tax=Rhizophlyctis rosea TaxID=64517 RepID=A0AAD5SIK7_9FUNG|nr:hypothetical protein HK097_002348 [Rhizophlyctis rosea]